jgi:biopolymer transport protein ExbD
MGDADYRDSGSAGTAIAIVALILLLLVGGLFVLGVGAWFFTRAEIREQQMRAVVQAERAEEMAQRARVEALEARAEAQARAERASVLPQARTAMERAGGADGTLDSVAESPPQPSAKRTEIVVQLDQQGATSVDGRQVDREALKAILQQAASDAETVVSVRLRIDSGCVFGEVAEVQSLCHDLGISEVLYTVAEPAGS